MRVDGNQPRAILDMNASDKRPAILVISRNLPPMVGGMERLVWHIVDELRAEYRVHVVGPTGCTPLLPDGVTATEVPLKPLFWYLLCSKASTLWQALRLRPRIVFAGSGLTAPFAWLAARLVGARAVVYLHGLDIESRQPIYRLLWRPFFRRCDQILVNSHFTHQLACDAGVAAERIAILHPGVELPDTRDAARQRTAFRHEYELGDFPIMLYVGRITARKGLALFVREILPGIIEQLPDAKLVVVGDEPTHALHHQQGEYKRVADTLAANGLTRSVLFLRNLDDRALDSAYFAADVLVFPVQQQSYDNEGFGMVAVEAAAHGTPTVAFAAGGVPDAVSDGVSGDLIPAGTYSAFADAVSVRLDSCDAKISESCREFALPFSWTAFGRRLRATVSIES